MNTAAPIDDQRAIRELVDAYGDAVCRRHADDWVMTWAPEGVWLIRGKIITGRAALRAAWVSAMAAYTQVQFTSDLGRIGIDGDVARACVRTTEWLTPVQGRPRRQDGIYDDYLVKLDRCWHFSQRSFTVIATQEL